MFNFMKKAAEKDDKEKRKREKKERKDVKKRDRSSMSAEELLRLDEVNARNVFAGTKKIISLRCSPFPSFSTNCKTITVISQIYLNCELIYQSLISDDSFTLNS